MKELQQKIALFALLASVAAPIFSMSLPGLLFGSTVVCFSSIMKNRNNHLNVNIAPAVNPGFYKTIRKLAREDELAMQKAEIDRRNQEVYNIAFAQAKIEFNEKINTHPVYCFVKKAALCAQRLRVFTWQSIKDSRAKGDQVRVDKAIKVQAYFLPKLKEAQNKAVDAEHEKTQNAVKKMKESNFHIVAVKEAYCQEFIENAIKDIKIPAPLPNSLVARIKLA